MRVTIYMKHTIRRPFLFVVFFLISFSCAFAQVDQFNSRPVKEKPQTKRVYLGFASGIDNYTGLIGPSLEVNIINGLTVYGGAGLGSWGYKASGGVKYYLKYPFKWAFNLGFSHATGIKDYTFEIETESPQGSVGITEVTMDWHPSNTLNISGLYHIRLGKKNRFNVELGYALPLTENFYTIKKGYELSDTGEANMQLLQPGGLIIGVGFTFGL